jgi:hypothetical protein
MHAQGGVRIPGHRRRHPGRGVRVGAIAAERIGELGLLGRGELSVHRALDVDLGMDKLVLQIGNCGRVVIMLTFRDRQRLVKPHIKPVESATILCGGSATERAGRRRT